MPKNKKAKIPRDIQTCNTSEDEQNASEEEIEVDFEAFGICDKDLDGIVTLLKQAFSGENIDVCELGKILTSQDGRGCIFMTALDDASSTKTKETNSNDDDDEIYGVVSFIDLNEHKDKKCINDLKSMIRKHVEETKSSNSPDVEEKILDFLKKIDSKNSRVAFIINERLLNLPYHIALPAFEGLSKEIESSKHRFDQFLMILKSQQIQNPSSSTSNENTRKEKSKTGQKRKSKSAKIDNIEDGVYFLNPEEEFLVEKCKVTLCYDAPTDEYQSSSSNGITKLKRTIVIFDRFTLNRFLQELKNDIQVHSA